MTENKKMFETKKIENFWGDDMVLSSADLIAVSEGIKKVTRLEYKDEEDLEKYKQALKLHNLDFVTSDKKLFETFSIYVSKDRSLANKAKAADPSVKIIGQGKTFNEVVDSVRDFSNLLSYPKCCVDKYIENTMGGSIGVNEADFLNKKPAKINFLFNNQLNGLSNYYLSFHMPCSLNCKKSQDYLGKIFKAIEKKSPAFALKITEHLKNPFLTFFDLSQPGVYAAWDKRQGFIFDGKVIGQELKYSAAIFFKTMYPEFKGQKEKKDLGSLKEVIESGDKITFSNKGFKVFKGSKQLAVYQNEKGLKSFLFNFI